MTECELPAGVSEHEAELFTLARSRGSRICILDADSCSDAWYTHSDSSLNQRSRIRLNPPKLTQPVILRLTLFPPFQAEHSCPKLVSKPIRLTAPDLQATETLESSPASS